MPRPLPDQTTRKEGVQYRLQKWVDEAVINCLENLSLFGEVEELEDGGVVLTLPHGAGKFKVDINYQVEVENHGDQDQAG